MRSQRKAPSLSAKLSYFWHPVMEASLPDIYYFNPTCEYAVANGHTSWQPNLLLQKMEEDLGTLPLYFAQPKDVVLVRKLPPPEFSETLKKASVGVPEFYDVSRELSESSFLQAPRNRILPWGWSPAAHRLLNPLKQTSSEKFKQSPVATWKDEYRDIYSKKFALDILIKILPLLPPELVTEPGQVPQICKTKQQIEALLGEWGALMVKAPWSSSGRGLQRVTKTPVVPKVWDKLLGIINDQGYAVVEPYLDKVLDMSLQFRLVNGEISFIGISRFFTDEKGQYQGNYLNGWPHFIGREETEFAESVTGILVPHLTSILEKSILSKYYEGNFGVDTLIFRDKKGDLRINPCLEINVKHTMGLLSLQLEKLLAPGRQGIYKICYNKGISFQTYAEAMKKRFPPEFKDNYIASGFMPLTPAVADSMFGACIIAGIDEQG